jgi:hypothetical protein
VNAEDLVIDDSRYWETIEALYELFPEFQGISSFAFIIESINSINGSALMITSEKEEVFRILDLISE